MTYEKKFIFMQKFNDIYDSMLEAIEAFKIDMITIDEALHYHNEMLTNWKILERDYGKKVTIDEVHEFFACYMVATDDCLLFNTKNNFK